ncbi:MAG: hypothetical protein S4CHLAM37_15090 [Chlamydiia bacterium]|nr:hypothetical protein [Chlamydiia bacterium]
MAAITPKDFVDREEKYSGSETDSAVGTMTPPPSSGASTPHDVVELDIRDMGTEEEVKEVATKVLRVVWFPRSDHAEVGIGDDMIYFIGKKPRYGVRSVAKAIARSGETPVILAKVAITEENFERMKRDLKDHPVSLINTCMGSVAEIVNRYAEVSIPPLISQGPTASGLYLMARESYSPDLVQVDLHGISKREIFTQCGESVMVEGIALILFIQLLYTLMTSLVM